MYVYVVMSKYLTIQSKHAIIVDRGLVQLYSYMRGLEGEMQDARYKNTRCKILLQAQSS